MTRLCWLNLAAVSAILFLISAHRSASFGALKLSDRFSILTMSFDGWRGLVGFVGVGFVVGGGCLAVVLNLGPVAYTFFRCVVVANGGCRWFGSVVSSSEYFAQLHVILA